LIDYAADFVDPGGRHRVNICTIIARNYAAYARVLANSFRAVHPDGTCSVLVIDDPGGYLDPAAEPFELITVDQIGLPDAERMATSYDVMEFSTAVKPWLLRHLLDRPGVDAVTYLDPDIRIFAPIDEIERRAREHGVVLTPHFTSPLPRDNLKPSEEDILIAGTYNLGFIGLGAGKTTDSLLEWWSERLERHCLNNPAQGHFVDQRWIDLAPGIWPGIDILRDPTFNIAYWNLPDRHLTSDGDDYLVNGRPLHFFHFSGFDPRHPAELSKHQTRIDVRANPALVKICAEYAAEMLAQGFEEAVGWPYGWDEMANGIRLDRAARQVHREAVEAGEITGSVFTPEGADRFLDLLTEPVEGSDAVNRYTQAFWDSRPDLREIFPNIYGEDAANFIDWLHVTGREEGAPAALLPAPRQRGRRTAGERPPPRPAAPRPGINVVGYVSSARGVGEVARQIHSALEAGGVPTTTIDSPAEPEKIRSTLSNLPADAYPYNFNLLCVNADMLPAVATALGKRFFRDRHSAGLWFWEVSHFPEMWKGSFEYVDEVWVGSEHIAQALRPVAPIPVSTVPPPVVPAPAADLSRAELGMPEGFCFLFLFDYRSVFRRKNPLGLVEAFCAAFEPGEGPSLVIKSICSDEFPVEREKLAKAVAGRPEIHLLEETVPAGAKNAMIAGCDCYISLHRSEGLGLTMAEAMYFGRPVIATGYSGNLDFMTAENSFLVPYSMAKIGPDAHPYPADKDWAEPDLVAAAELMRRVYEHPAEAGGRGERAAVDIRRTHSPEAARETIEARVEQARRSGLRRRLQPPSREQTMHGSAEGGRPQLEHLLSFGGPPTRPDAGNLQTSVKNLYMRLLQPYAAYQQRINESVAESLDELRGALVEALRMEGDLDARSREITDWIDANRRRIAGIEEFAQAATAVPYMAEEWLTAQDNPALGETLGFRASAGRGNGNGYRRFEDMFRGPEQMIQERQRVYVGLVEDHQPVLDAGCGRGEFLELLAERGIEARGVDLDPTMVARCREQGLENVEQGDLLAALEEAPEKSLGTIFSAQVIEHLEFEQLQRLLELGLSRLKPGGLLIAETVNPHSVAALKAFWVDPTHIQPLFPETMLALCEEAGYEAGDVFAPAGSGSWERDRTRAGEYALVAVAPGAGS
jgi:glycosyltransferase involved in cell wall biosynthesis/SAM-dependent methyltransferase